MTDLLSELEVVVTAFDRYAGEYSQAELIEASNKEAKFLRTHHAEIAAAVRDAEVTKRAAEKLCRVYFEIAAEAVGEDAVRSERDRRIAAMSREAAES